MKSKTRRIILAVTVIGALAAGGAAFTLGNPVASGQSLGYYSQAITAPGTAGSVAYTYSADGTTVASVSVAFTAVTASMAPDTIKVGFDGTYAADNQSNVDGDACTAGTWATPADTQTVTCAFTGTNPTVSGITGRLNVLITNP